jgi:hypothetical protein
MRARYLVAVVVGVGALVGGAEFTPMNVEHLATVTFPADWGR